MISIKGLMKLIRPINCLMMGFAVIISMIIASQGFPQINILILGFLTAFSLTAASMAINDYFDYDIDLINAPWRPLPSGLVSKTQAIICTLLFSIVGIISSLLINLECFILALIAIIVSVLYSFKGKKYGLLGNFMVSFCVALPFLYGSLAVKARGSFLLQIFSLAAFLANTGREVAKGMVDVNGDTVKGIKTIAILYGLRIASLLTLIFYLLAVIVGLFPIIFRIVSWPYLPLYILSSLGFLVDSIQLTINPTAENAKNVKRRTLIYMFLAMLAVFLGGLKFKLTYWWCEY
ncbi:MAG: hypothetical protein DRJ21_01865 [Candidatus Methanomethylicota archaeon]|uniref:Geranylgeranylglycerol-phosphate geranylgeranyltransferase n=1 Tax=Thermoproteota archaeon TaxID=2056631 RepID=A0A497ET39_9CREN|nr:MAG: hypothetical protein DRJ21_01865 [Candidatus Verstraetearchaeota archaeon]